MGTNFYAEKMYYGHAWMLHIGKSSAGWPFIWAYHDPDNGQTETLTNFDEWKEFLEHESVSIVDEHGRDWNKKDFFDQAYYTRKIRDLPSGLSYADLEFYKNIKGHWFIVDCAPEMWS